MTEDEVKILAMTECLILWDYLAETGEDSKSRAALYLYENNKLSMGEYNHGCPLCEYIRHTDGLNDIDLGEGCQKCLWPKDQYYTAYTIPCVHRKSPFRAWQGARTPAARKAAAKEVLNMLLAIEF